MVAATSARRGRGKGTFIVDLVYDPAADQKFTRADLVFTGVDHSTSSYEVRAFLNQARASMTTPRTPDEGYAGRFHILGHGGCFGDVGHCDVQARSSDPTDLRPPHALTPLTTYLTITTALRRLFADGSALRAVTLVPISITPRRRDRAPAPELFTFDAVELQTYLTAVEGDALA